MLAWGSPSLGSSKGGVACFRLAPNGMVYPYALVNSSSAYPPPRADPRASAFF